MKRAAASEPRTKKAEATREAILNAARERFTRDGFGVGVRDIAEAAGVNVALLNRYFGSKAELFAEVIGQGFDLSPLLEGPREEFGARLARYALTKPKQGPDPILVLLRSAGHEEARARFRRLVDETFVVPLSGWLEGPQRRARAALIAGELLGIAVLRDVVETDAITDAAPVIEAAGRAIQVHVTPPKR